MRLDPIAVAAGVRLETFASVGSTNKEARLRARRGDAVPLWITAVTQTEGRGRMDRSWASPPGNLYASLLLREPASPERAPELGFVAALAVRDAVIAEAAGLAPQLAFKWPNDLLLGGNKCAGILIEGEVDIANRVNAVIGIGVNCASHPDNTAYPATDLAAHGAAVAPERLFRQLSAAMCRRLAIWDRGQAFSAILGDWLAAVSGLGEEIIVRNGSGERRGRFVGLDPAGRLILQTSAGAAEKISAGDVFPLDVRGQQRVPSRAE